MGTVEKFYIDQLYKLLAETERKGDRDTGAALRWAILNLEHIYK